MMKQQLSHAKKGKRVIACVINIVFAAIYSFQVVTSSVYHIQYNQTGIPITEEQFQCK